MQDACEVTITELPPELLFDDVNGCRIRQVTRTELVLPVTMSVVKSDDVESFIDESMDTCCLSYGDYNDEFVGSCARIVLDSNSELSFREDDNSCFIVSET